MKLIAPSELKRKIRGKKLLIDTNIIIYLTDTIQPYEPLSRLIFEMIETGDASAVLSIISIAEIMKGPINVGQHSICFGRQKISPEFSKYLLSGNNVGGSGTYRGKQFG